MDKQNEKGMDDLDASSSVVDDEEAFEIEQKDREERDELKEVHKLTRRETTRVWIWKAVLLVTIMCAAALVTAGTYRILSDEEEDDFTTSFDLFAVTVQDGLRFHLSSFELATDSMASAIPGYASAHNETFPFVTMPDFEVLGQTVRRQSGIEVLWWTPYVSPEQTELWGKYAAANVNWWIDESRSTALTASAGSLSSSDYDHDTAFLTEIWQSRTSNDPITPMQPDSPFYSPIWHQTPPPFANWVINYDMMKLTVSNRMPSASVMRALQPNFVFGLVHNVDYMANSALKEEEHELYHESLVQWQKEGINSTFEHPHCFFTLPVFGEVNDDASDMVGQLTGVVAWDAYLVDLVPNGVKGITVVLENTCNQSFTYELVGGSAFYRGDEDMHDKKYDHMRKRAPFHRFEDPAKAGQVQGQCVFSFSIYPTQEFEDEYRTILPTILAVVVGATFFVMVAFFAVYDWFVHSRNTKIVGAAARSNEIVSSMFPSQVRDKLFEQKKQERQEKHLDPWAASGPHTVPSSKTIAEFYPSATIMFADIVGFTAWSSIREPAQVFELLETLYAAFDEIAKTRRIFKVETVGDCYVACAGVPEPRKDHPTAMARFARDCRESMEGLLKKLEVTLGPDTGDLRMRFGLHSGSVTAGVLRGDRARFQLFGDTMNTASRMESTGKPNQIQLSQDTAELLRTAGKDNWLTPREEMIEVKGKGLMVTYWLNATSSHADTSTAADSSLGMSSDNCDAMFITLQNEQRKAKDAKMARLVEWNVEIVTNLLHQIEAHRDLEERGGNGVSAEVTFGSLSQQNGVLDEVQEVINLPKFSGQPSRDPKSVKLSDKVVEQMHDFVVTVAASYNHNPFHNFEHASHVTMSMVKLLARVVNPKVDGIEEQFDHNSEDKASMLHDFTYGITSDPLMQFACVFSTMIHDMDHPGVPNSTLVKENSSLAATYKRSIAEQNSFDIAWALFMDDKYKDFRAAVACNPDELKRFRQITINLIMATDIIDKDLSGFRNQRWERAFGSQADIEEVEKDRVNRKATIVIEHMIQASDVAHTMQHWRVYIKWNKRFFMENYEAYVTGRSDKDPSINWYEGEMGFFDFYIIPLAKKLADCGVFGVASSEYLDYAVRNRREWEDRGKEVVAEMLEETKAMLQRKMREERTPLTEEIEDLSGEEENENMGGMSLSEGSESLEDEAIIV